jgi:uncharacterized protein YeaO (DUF488 family)
MDARFNKEMSALYGGKQLAERRQPPSYNIREMPVILKRAYEKASPGDGARVLVDRLWPRGLTKAAARLDAWLRDLAPSDELRRWYHGRPAQWLQFRRKYLEELGQPEAASALAQLYDLARRSQKLTLVFASKNLERNNAVVLKELLDGMRKPPHSSGPEKAASGAVRLRRSVK